MRSIFCTFGLHRYKLAREILQYYSQKVGPKREAYDVHLMQCSGCGKGKMKVKGGKHAKYHRGIMDLRARWEGAS